MQKSTLRKYISITLSHAEKRDVTQEQVSQRLREAFQCTAVVVTKEKHEEGGFHYHVAIQNKDASKNNATRTIREILPEFEGKQCDVRFPKGWATICAYITKEDKEPLVWGEYDKKQILEIAESARKHKKNKNIPTELILSQLKECDDWLKVYENEILRERLITSYNNLKKIHEDLQTIKQIQQTVGERIIQYLNDNDWPEEYTPEHLKEKYILLDWIACQLIFQRPIKTKQLFIYGAPSTQKTLILSYLAKVLRVYFVSSRINDFAGADNNYDLWVFDEFHEPDGEASYLTAATEAGTAYANTLLKVLDGQECRLDSKYGKIFTKKGNVPIIMMANELPKRVTRKGPLQERIMRMHFKSQIENIEENRIIATLWGCIKRRAGRNIEMQRKENLKQDIIIKYNKSTAIIKNYRKNRRKAVTEEKEEMEIKTIIHKYEPEIRIRGIDDTYKYRVATIKEETMRGDILSILNYAIIPIKKTNSKKNELTKIQMFYDFREAANFWIHRNKEQELMDYITWPIRMESHSEHDKMLVLLQLDQGNQKRKVKLPGNEGETTEEQIVDTEKKEITVKILLGLGHFDEPWREDD